MNSRGARVVALFASLAAMSACKTDEPAARTLPDLDFQPSADLVAQFDKNAIFDVATFTDATSIDEKSLGEFFRKSPYGGASFLETYQSNGKQAAEAIIGAGRTHQINPIVLLVYAEALRGLVAERNYPAPPARVEYAFGCGCTEEGKCAPELAGFDRQVDCLANQLRTALFEIASTGAAASGWGPKKPATTLDGQGVTPANDATAALYARTPVVAEGREGGTWIVWNVYQRYAAALEYDGPSNPQGGGAWIGEECETREDCGVQGAICASNYPGGSCTATCVDTCPARSDRPEAFCAAFSDGGFCMPTCSPSASSCREGYRCAAAKRVGGNPTDTQNVCVPDSVTLP